MFHVHARTHSTEQKEEALLFKCITLFAPPNFRVYAYHIHSKFGYFIQPDIKKGKLLIHFHFVLEILKFSNLICVTIHIFMSSSRLMFVTCVFYYKGLMKCNENWVIDCRSQMPGGELCSLKL